MECIEDQWVRGGGDAESVREGGIDDIDRERLQEEGDIIVFCVRGGNVIQSAG